MIHLWIQERLPMESRTKLSKKAIELVYQARGAADLAGKLKPFERRVVPHLDAVLKSFQIYHCRAPRTVEATMKPPNISDTWLAGVIEVVCDWFLWSQGIAEDIWYLTLSFVRGNDFARPLWRNLYSLGAIYQHRGLVENAEALYRWTLADAWSRLPRRHPGPLAIVGDLALSIYNQKRLEESLQWYRWALDARSKVLGKTHPATMGAVFGIGLVHEVQGRYDEALELYEIALAGRKKRLGRNDVLTLNVVNSLVGLLQDTMSDEALLWREREVEWKNERSDQTPWQAYADSLEISKSFLVVHQYKKAKEWATKSLALSKLLESNGMVARGLNQVLFDILGDLCYQSSEYEEALQWYTKLLGEIREYCDCDEYAPDEAAKCSQAFHDLGRTSHALGRHKDALDWWLKCMRIEKAHRRWMGPTKAGWLIQLYTVMADSFDKENQPNDALEWRAQAYYLQNEHPKHSIPAYNPAKDQLLYGMAKSLEKLRRWDEAATIWEEILPRMEFTFGCHDQYTKHILSNLMHARFNGARYDEALKHGRQLLIEETYHASDDRPEIYNVIGVLGLIHTHRGQYEEGLYLLTAALEGNQRHLDHDHWIVSVAMYDIALAYWLQKAYDKSFDWIRRAFEADADDHLQCAAKVRDFEGVIDKGLNRDVEELRILCERHLLPKVTQT